MANSISDVTVNISVEDVINPAAFGTPLLYAPSDTATDVLLDYTECYDLDEVREAVMSSDIKSSGTSYTITATAGESVSGSDLSNTPSGVTFSSTKTFTVEENNKSYGKKSFSKRVKSIEKGDLTVVPGYDFISIYGICSSKDSTVDVVLYDVENNVEFARQTIGGEDICKVTFEVGSDNHATGFYIYGESAESKTLHIYGIDFDSLGEDGKVIIEAAERMFMQDNPPERIAVLCTGTDALNGYFARDWRQLIYCTSSADATKAEKVAAMIESAEEMKIMFYGTPYQKDSIRGKLSKAYERVYQLASSKNTSSNYEAVTEACAGVAALVAITCNKPVGSFTYKNMQLAYCVPVENIGRSELNVYHDANVNVLVTKAGYDVTSEGKTLSGEYLDIVDTKDWLITQIEYQLQQALIINDKVPYDNNGISLLENVVVNILQDAYNNGMIATDDDGNPAYTVDFAPRSETKASDREVRRYVEGKFTFDLAGAIHTVTINGTIRI